MHFGESVTIMEAKAKSRNTQRRYSPDAQCCGATLWETGSGCSWCKGTKVTTCNNLKESKTKEPEEIWGNWVAWKMMKHLHPDGGAVQNDSALVSYCEQKSTDLSVEKLLFAVSPVSGSILRLVWWLLRLSGLRWSISDKFPRNHSKPREDRHKYGNLLVTYACFLSRLLSPHLCRIIFLTRKINIWVPWLQVINTIVLELGAVNQ